MANGERTAIEHLKDAIHVGGPGDPRLKIALERIGARASRGLRDEHFAELVDVWLGCDLAIRNWTALGNVLVPERTAPDRVVDRAARWLRCNFRDERNATRVVHVLGWLQGLTEYGLLDPSALDAHYDFFFVLLNVNKYSSAAAKFVYTLSKPYDVTGTRVRFLLGLTKKEKSSKFCNSAYAILNLFKSYKPERIPENVPAVSVSAAFPKVNKTLAVAFQQAQTRCSIRTALISENRTMWWRPPTSDCKYKNSVMIPDIEYIHVRSSLYVGEADSKKCIEFENARELIVYNLGHSLETPGNVLSLLVNEAGLHLLMFAEESLKTRFLYNLYHILHNNYLKKSSFTYEDKKVFLRRIVNLQNYIVQGLHVVSRFLAIYISDWNGHDFFDEILSLLEWITFENFEELYDCILEHIESLYLTNNIYYQCAIVNMLRRMYMRIFQRFNSPRVEFFPTREVKDGPTYVLSSLTDFIMELCDKSSSDIYKSAILRNAFLDAYTLISDLQAECGHHLISFPPISLVYGVLCSPSSFAIDKMLGLILKYRVIYEKRELNVKEGEEKLLVWLQTFSDDYANCLWYGESIKSRNKGFLLKKLHPNLVDDLENNSVENFDSLLDISHHIAFAYYTYFQLPMNMLDLDKTMLLQTLISPCFDNISTFVDNIM